MAVKGRFSLDTNILVYAVDRDSGERHELASKLIGRASADKNEHKNQERSNGGCMHLALAKENASKSSQKLDLLSENYLICLYL